jgi:ABC-2 type transport system ATP-binding protein
LVSHEGVTVFLTTHNMAEAEKLCRQVAVIRKGKLLAVGSPDELKRHAGAPRLEVVGSGFSDAVLSQLRAQPEVSAVELQDKRLLIHLRQDVDTAPLVTMMVAAGAQVEEVHKGRASLEEVFLTLMEEER